MEEVRRLWTLFGEVWANALMLQRHQSQIHLSAILGVRPRWRTSAHPEARHLLLSFFQVAIEHVLRPHPLDGPVFSIKMSDWFWSALELELAHFSLLTEAIFREIQQNIRSPALLTLTHHFLDSSFHEDVELFQDLLLLRLEMRLLELWHFVVKDVREDVNFLVEH